MASDSSGDESMVVEESASKKSKGKSIKVKIRQYSIAYLEFGFVPYKHDQTRPYCLLCPSGKTILTNASMKHNKLKKHYQIHQDKQNITREELLRLKQKYEQSSKMQLTIHQTAKRNENMMEKGLLSSFRISLLIAKSGKPHTIGESLLNPVIKEVLENMVGTSSNTVL